MKAEHCSKGGCKVLFANHESEAKTCPANEWAVTVDGDHSKANMRRGRRLPNIQDLMEHSTSKDAMLTRPEVISVVLYTGPMVRQSAFQSNASEKHKLVCVILTRLFRLLQYGRYNTALRHWPEEDYLAMKECDNLYATTIHVLVSAVLKISRVMKLPEGLRLYRGLGGLLDLPDSFMDADKFVLHEKNQLS
jgi:hypothetical protein